MCARVLTLALAAAVLAAGPTRAADPPPVTFQTLPLGDGIKIVRTVATWVPQAANEPDFKKFMTVLNDLLDPKTSGLDPSRPVVGYVLIPANVQASVGVAAIPVSDAKTFQAYVEKNAKTKPKDLGNGLYELDANKKDDVRAVYRAQGQHVFLAIGKDPVAALDPKAIVDPATLPDPKERALVSARVHFDRLPKELRANAVKTIDAALREMEKALVQPGAAPEARQAGEQVMKMLTRYAGQFEEAEGVTARVDINAATGEFAISASLNPKAGTSLAKDIAARKPTTNKFAGLLGPDAAVGGLVRLPLWSEELQNAATIGLNALQKQVLSDAGTKPFEPIIKEAFAGLTRTVKTGEFDLAGAVRGPDKDGFFTAVVAVAFEDPAKLEQEIKNAVATFGKDNPDVAKMVVFDAGKAGAVNIHRINLPPVLPPEATKLFGQKASVAVAFAPHGIFLAFGPDPVAALQQAVPLKPAPAPDFDLAVNPSRLGKLAGGFGGQDVSGMVAKALGTEDKLISAFNVSASAGNALTVRIGMNLKMIMSIGGVSQGKASSSPPKTSPVPPPPPKR